MVQNANVTGGEIGKALIAKNSSRALKRALKKKCDLPPLYHAKTPMWNPDTVSKSEEYLAYMPIHETLYSQVKEADVDRWTSFNQQQAGFKANLLDWVVGLGIALSLAVQPWVVLSLWGDSAPSTCKVALFVLLFGVPNGQQRQTFWIITILKSRLCKCGCGGRCTLGAMFEVMRWSALALMSGKMPRRDHRGRRCPRNSWRARHAGKRIPVFGATLRNIVDLQWMKRA